MTDAQHCYHCHLPVPVDVDLTTEVLGEPRSMCCPGCQAVATAIVANGLEDYYRFRSEPAQPGSDLLDDTLGQLALYDDSDIQDEFVYTQGEHKQSIQLTLEGITCAACGWLIEKQLAKIDGILQVAVNVTERRALITWHADKIKLSQILSALKNIGYDALPFQPDQHEASFRKEQKTLLKKVGLAGLMTMQVMMLMTGLYFDLFGAMEAETVQYFYWIALVLTTPVVLYSGSVFYLGALKAISAKTVNMDVPVTIAIFGTYVAGIKSTILMRGDVYFESICMFVFLLLLSRFLEHRSRYRASQISANMMQHIPVTANKLNDQNQVESCLAKHLQVGDSVIVKAGDTIPVDGEIIDGMASIDESMLTGEFEPITKQSGDIVYGGTVSQNGSLTIKVRHTLKDALVNQILRLQAEAMAQKPKVAQVADQFSRYFVVAVLLISGGAFAYWTLQGDKEAFWIAIAVLVATCPCALGLATPSALTCAMASLNRRGILLKRADVLEQMNDIDTIVLDKTGTLTEGKFSLRDVWLAQPDDHDEIMAIAASLESRSEHPLAHAFKSESLLAIDNFNVAIGAGISGVIAEQNYKMGSSAFVGAVPKSIPFEPNVVLSRNEEIIAAFAVSDTLKADATATLEQLADYRLVLLSGDSSSNVANIAKQLGIDEVLAAQTPQMKLDYVAMHQREGRHIMMLGDGINDAPVLANASISVAVGNATDVARSAADIILLGDELTSIKPLLDLAQKTQRLIKQNMAWAVGYNLLILPFAVSGILTPWMAVIGMSLSSIIVVSNSTRLLK